MCRGASYHLIIVTLDHDVWIISDIIIIIISSGFIARVRADQEDFKDPLEDCF